MQNAENTCEPLLEVASGDSSSPKDRWRQLSGERGDWSEARKKCFEERDGWSKRTKLLVPRKVVKESVAKVNLPQYEQNGEALVNMQFFDANASASGHGKKLPQCNYNRFTIFSRIKKLTFTASAPHS
ncbi:hypothetical protein RvY_17331 [Ramazzottius varieornatus]|uniref:Uncharacterized protein n=1 Tax=Ramazzottius varieornatus TaxID=947166 RepID=A0A1D1W1R0_RAMVA|nr:hypothetical protein RvY_17331 [Ramazzottius varieornatus]